MPTTKTGYVNGSDMLLIVGGKAIGHCTTHTVTLNSETKDRAVKPVQSASLSAGLWKHKSVTSLNVSITGEGLAFYAEAENGYAELLALWKEGAPVAVKCCERDEDTNPYLSGNFVITSLERTDPADDDATYTINLENDGEVTINEDAITVASVSGSGS